MSYQTEFPDFDPATMPDLTMLPGFRDISWKQDMGPFFQRNTVTVMVDYANPDQREIPNTPRFCVTIVTDAIGHERTLIETDDWAEACAVAMAAVNGETQRERAIVEFEIA